MLEEEEEEEEEDHKSQMNIAQEVIWSLPHMWDFSVLGALHHGSSPHAFSRAHLMSMSLHDW